MSFQFATLRPLISRVMVIYITDEQALFAAMYNQANIAIDAHRGKVGILGLIQFMEIHPRAGRVDLQIKDGSLDRFLLLIIQVSKAAYKSICNSKFHLFILIDTFTRRFSDKMRKTP